MAIILMQINPMNPNQTNEYSPANDDNQGVAQLLAQAQEANNGVSQVEQMNPVTNQGPEPVKEEVNDNPSDTGSNGANDDLLAEEDVENGDVETDNE